MRRVSRRGAMADLKTTASWPTMPLTCTLESCEHHMKWAAGLRCTGKSHAAVAGTGMLLVVLRVTLAFLTRFGGHC